MSDGERTVDDHALVVNSVLTDYIAIHDDVLDSPVRRSIPFRGLFKAIDFQSHTTSLLGLISTLDAVRSALVGGSHQRRPDSERYAAVLSQYTDHLFVAITKLHDICAKLGRVADGSIRSYRWRDYRRDLADYQSAVNDYVGLGIALNEARREHLRDEPGEGSSATLDTSEKAVMELDREVKSTDPVGPTITAHIFDTTGGVDPTDFDNPNLFDDMVRARPTYRTARWTVGKDVSWDTYQQFGEPFAGDIHVWIDFHKSEIRERCMPRALWEAMRRLNK